MSDSGWYSREGASYTTFVSSWLVAAMTPRIRALAEPNEEPTDMTCCPAPAAVGSCEHVRGGPRIETH